MGILSTKFSVPFRGAMDRRRRNDRNDTGGVVLDRVFEQAMLTVRWWAVIVLVGTTTLAPRYAWPYLLTIAALVALGNIVIARYLASRASGHLVRARQLATIIEWAGGTSALFLHSERAIAATPSVALLLILATSIRFGVRGLIGATVAVSGITSVYVLAQVHVHNLFPLDTGIHLLIDRLAMISMMAALTGALLLLLRQRRDAATDDQRQPLTAAEYIAARRAAAGLSGREGEVLELIAQPDADNRTVADALHISPGTVKSHVYHIGVKLGVSGGRQTVVDTALERGLLPETGDVDVVVEETSTAGVTDFQPPVD